MGAALRAAAADDNVRAAVLVWNSPGGSAVASEMIWRQWPGAEYGRAPTPSMPAWLTALAGLGYKAGRELRLTGCSGH